MCIRDRVTDFANTDNEWHKEVDALRKMCELNGIRPLVERSRSGKGAHVWICLLYTSYTDIVCYSSDYIL